MYRNMNTMFRYCFKHMTMQGQFTFLKKLTVILKKNNNNNNIRKL